MNAVAEITPGRRAEVVRWVICFAVVVATHGLAAVALTNDSPEVSDFGVNVPVVYVDLDRPESFVPQMAPEQTVIALCHDEKAWVRACALFYAAHRGFMGALDDVVAGIADQSAVVREASLVSCWLLSPERARSLAEARLTDEAPVVRRQAALISTRRVQAEGLAG